MKLRLNTFLRSVEALSDGAVAETVRRYVMGEINRDDRRFCPSCEEFTVEAKHVEKQFALKERPPIAGPVEIKRSASSLRFQERVQNRIAEYRRTYLEAKAKDPTLQYVDHIVAEYKRGTGRALNIPKPDPKALLKAQVAKQDAVFADELARVRAKHFSADAPKQRGAA